MGFAFGFVERYERHHLFFLKEMCIAPDRQRSGVGSRIMIQLLKQLGKTGLRPHGLPIFHYPRNGITIRVERCIVFM